MDQAARVRRLEPFGDLPADPQHFLDGQGAGALEPSVERLAAEEFHRQKRDAAVLADLVDVDDVIVLDRRGGLGFAQESLLGDGGNTEPGEHRLERDRPLEQRVFGLEDHAHAAAAQHLEDAIGAEPADLVVGLRRREKVVKLALRGGRQVKRRLDLVVAALPRPGQAEPSGCRLNPDPRRR